MRLILWILMVVFAFWFVFRGKSFTLTALRILNIRGPLRFEALICEMRYFENNKVGLIGGIRISFYLNAMLSAANDGLLSIYTETNEHPRITFHITMKVRGFCRKVDGMTGENARFP